jgi:hypothetical protein
MSIIAPAPYAEHSGHAWAMVFWRGSSIFMDLIEQVGKNDYANFK